MFLSYQPSYVQANVLISGTEGLYFLIKETFESIHYSGECVEDVVNNQANYQFTPMIVIYFMSVTGYQKKNF